MGKTKKKNQVVLKRHSFYRALVFPFIKLLALMKGYKNKSHFKIRKGESYLVLSNHQTDFDGIFIMLSFNKMLYPVATDTVMSNGFTSKVIHHCFGLIPKKKGTVDFEANKKMFRCFMEGGSLLLFPEGNRSYAEFQFSFTKGFAKFVKTLKKDVILFNFHGGTGSYPRFASKRRKGPFYGKIRKILRYEDIKDMPDDELYELISLNLKVYDSESNAKYISKNRAEYLERMFFVCPKCGKVECLYSEGNYIICKECGFETEYTEDLHLIPNDKEIKINKMLDWFNYQIRYINNLEIKDGVIFSDEDVELYATEIFKKRRLVTKGKLELYKDKMIVNDFVIDIKDIRNASPTGTRKLGFTVEDQDYFIIGSERFNSLKYVFMFNKLETKMKESGVDIYYSLEERKE